MDMATMPRTPSHGTVAPKSDAEVIRFALMLSKFQIMTADEQVLQSFPSKDKSVFLEVHIDLPELNTVRASALMFPAYGTQVLEEYLPWLDHLALVLNNHPRCVLSIDAYTDSIGSFEENRKLSDERALQVKQHMMDRGVHEQRMRTKGWGEQLPIAENSTKEGRQRNRRVEFTTYFPVQRKGPDN